MSTDAADIIAQAIRVADGSHTLGAGALGEALAAALEGHAVIDGQVVKVERSGYVYDPDQQRPRCADDHFEHVEGCKVCKPMLRIVDGKS